MDNSTGFSSLNTGNDAIPSTPAQAITPDPDALNLINPDSILSGTLRGQQFVGSPALQIDSTDGVITVNSLTSSTNVLKLGNTGTNLLGLSLANGNGTDSLLLGEQSDNSLGLNILSSAGNPVMFAGSQSDGSVGLAILDSSKNDVLFAGEDSTGATVVKIARPGFDARTAGNNNLVLNSSPLKLQLPFSFTSGSSANAGTFSLSHGLGYIPNYSAEVNITNNQVSSGQVGNFALPYLLMGAGGGTTNVFVVLAFVHLLSLSTSTFVFEVGAEGPSQNIAGLITVYIQPGTAN